MAMWNMLGGLFVLLGIISLSVSMGAFMEMVVEPSTRDRSFRTGLALIAVTIILTAVSGICFDSGSSGNAF